MTVTLHGRALWLAWFVFAGYATASVWIVGTEVVRIVLGDGRLVGQLTVGALPAALAGTPLTSAAYLALAGITYVLVKVAYFGAAAMLAWRRPKEAIALFVAVYLVTTEAAVFPPEIIAIMPSDPLRAWIELVIVFTWLMAFAWLFFLFPDGHFTPRWTILIAAIWLVEGLYSAWQLFAFAVDTQLEDAIATAVVALAAVVAQGYRYFRVSDERQRQQTKWFLGGLGIAFVGFTVGDAYIRANGLMTESLPPERTALPWLVQLFIISLTGLCVPVALMIALLRYRLFDIDLLLRRALVYGALTALVVGVYVIIVGALGTLFSTDNLVVSLAATACVALVFQPLRAWLQRRATRLIYGERDEPYTVISRLGRRLEATLAPAEILPAIVETVASALRLPYAAIALDDGRGGSAIEASAGERPPAEPLRLPLTYQGEAIGELLLAPPTPGEAFSSADRRLLNDLARQAGVAARAVRLAEESMRLASDLQTSRERLVTAREEERRSIRRDLHDGLGPTLASLRMQLGALRRVVRDDPTGAEAQVDELREDVASATADIRRLVHELRPPLLDEHGLAGALRDLGRVLEPGMLTVELPASLPPLAAAVEVAAYRIAGEAVHNVAKHARATRCTLRLVLTDAALVLDIIDDGVGMASKNGAGVGLASMRERAAELSGILSITPNPAGGTRVSATIPRR